ncbi:F0F1 ATP synthase subunit B [Flavobacterium crassostreae]|uniref:ATP synthase subunit b n=1 Tax=Flavobacterium crassostreae TaxID=1763534 RepID=A0A1B9E9A3_9FLAO|nr:F0F1 ATP synthase subunit B [Flavobacterium crassostreae]OCB78512.1 F0F1 ATP synthase subunit B [Flavobacterium crassostreae]
MQINWFTVLAQLVNFIVLVWLLKRFLYKPILKAIDEREKNIAGKINAAEAKDALAKKEQTAFKQKNESFDKEKKGLMDQAIAETNKEKEKLLESARNEAAELRSKLEKSVAEMQENLNRDLAQKAQKEVFAIAKKTLNDLASLSLEEQSTKVFITRLKELQKEEKEQFLEAFKMGSNQPEKQDTVLIQSAFDLPEEQQTAIKNMVNEILGTTTPFQFKTAPEIISGIELSSNGYKVAWSIAAYLNSLQKSISDTLNDKVVKD